MTATVTNLKTQVQARIDAATGATSLEDLLILRKAAEGLGCNETNLDALVTAALNAMGGSTPLDDLLMGNKASAIPESSGSTITATLPIATSAGELLYMDVFGQITKEQYPAAASTISAGSVAGGLTCTAFAGHYTTGFGASLIHCGALLMSDGNIARVSFGNISGTLFLFFDVWNATGDRVSSGVNPAGIGFYTTAYQAYVIGARVSGSTISIYYTSSESDGISEQITLYRLNLSYSAANITAASNTRIGSYFNQGQSATSGLIPQTARYIPFSVLSGASNKAIAILDMVNSTYVVYSATASAAGVSFHSLFDEANSTYKASIYILSSGVTGLIDTGGVTKTMPAAAGASSGYNYTLLAARTWLQYRQNLTARVLVFNADYTSVTVFDLGVVLSTTNIVGQVFKVGSKFIALGDAGAAVQFNLQSDSVSNILAWPVGKFPSFWLSSRALSALDISASSRVFVTTRTNDTSGSSQNATLALQMGALFNLTPTLFGSVIVGAAANSPCMLSLNENCIPEESASTYQDVVTNGIAVRLKQVPTLYKGGSTNTTNILRKTASGKLGVGNFSGKTLLFKTPTKLEMSLANGSNTRWFAIVSPLFNYIINNATTSSLFDIDSQIPFLVYSNYDTPIINSIEELV